MDGRLHLKIELFVNYYIMLFYIFMFVFWAL